MTPRRRPPTTPRGEPGSVGSGNDGTGGVGTWTTGGGATGCGATGCGTAGGCGVGAGAAPPLPATPEPPELPAPPALPVVAEAPDPAGAETVPGLAGPLAFCGGVETVDPAGATVRAILVPFATHAFAPGVCRITTSSVRPVAGSQDSVRNSIENPRARNTSAARVSERPTTSGTERLTTGAASAAGMREGVCAGIRSAAPSGVTASAATNAAVRTAPVGSGYSTITSPMRRSPPTRAVCLPAILSSLPMNRSTGGSPVDGEDGTPRAPDSCGRPGDCQAGSLGSPARERLRPAR